MMLDTLKSEAAIAAARQTPVRRHMNTYTLVIGYEGNKDTFVEAVTARTPQDALDIARRKMHEHTYGSLDDYGEVSPNDAYPVIAIFEGAHVDIYDPYTD